MNIRQTQRLMWCTGGTLVLAAAGVVTAASLWPYGVPDTLESTTTTTTTAATQQPRPALPELSSFAEAWSVNLRRSVPTNTTPVKIQPPKKPRPNLSARLAGTVVEQGHSVAMFVTQAGKIELKSVGERVDNALIRNITQTGVTVQYHGELIELTLEQDTP